jgi:tetratricopeptide (TPR) repeat protein
MSSPASQLSSRLRDAAPVVRTADEWAGVAAQYLKEGERPQAIDALRAAVSLDPAHGAAGLLITTLHESGNVEEAFARGQRYHREGPRNPRALFRFGWLLAFIGEIDPAQALFRDLVVLDQGGLYEAWGNGELAHLARARGDARAAVSFMERAVAAQPGDMISRVGLAQMMVEAGQASAAVPLLEAELAAQPAARGYGGMPAALVLGWALRLLGHETTANRWLDALESTLLGNWAWSRCRCCGNSRTWPFVAGMKRPSSWRSARTALPSTAHPTPATGCSRRSSASHAGRPC